MLFNKIDLQPITIRLVMKIEQNVKSKLSSKEDSNTCSLNAR